MNPAEPERPDPPVDATQPDHPLVERLFDHPQAGAPDATMSLKASCSQDRSLQALGLQRAAALEGVTRPFVGCDLTPDEESEFYEILRSPQVRQFLDASTEVWTRHDREKRIGMLHRFLRHLGWGA